MRVLMLVSEAPPIKSGISRVAGELTERLRHRGVEIDMLSANEIPRGTFKEFRLSSLALHWPHIQRRLREYDILHVHGVVPTFSDVGLILGRIGGRTSCPTQAMIYTHHSDIDIAGLDIPAGIYNKMHRRLLRLADHVVASTPNYALQLESSARLGRVSAVRFGVRADNFQTLNTKSSRLNVLFVGQLRPYKGVDVLLKAWRHLDGTADLHIVGDGHDCENLKMRATELGLSSVTFHGSVSDAQLQEFYAQAHVLVLPSTRKAEAFGLVLLEGMAAGCVPIASSLPGVSDVVNTTGFTFPVGDSKILSQILIRLRDEPSTRKTMALLAEARAIACDWDYTAETYLGIYRQAHLGRQLEVALNKGKGDASPAVLQEWLENVASASGADRASLMLVSPDGRDLRFVASVGINAEIAATTSIPVGQRMSGFAAQTGKSMLVRRRSMPALARIYRNQPDLTSSLILPLNLGGQPVGVLNLGRGPERFAFTDNDERWLHRLAMQVAPLIASRYETGRGMAALASRWYGGVIQPITASIPNHGKSSNSNGNHVSHLVVPASRAVAERSRR